MVISTRKQFNMQALMTKVDQKANDRDVTTIFEVQDVKINTLDNNCLLLAKDFQTFQKLINKIHQSVVELQEVNKDVLLGNKPANCLSCNRGAEGYASQHLVKGKDGQFYVGLSNQNKKL